MRSKVASTVVFETQPRFTAAVRHGCVSKRGIDERRVELD